jgi:DNA-binding response OmpR family regulator
MRTLLIAGSSQEKALKPILKKAGLTVQVLDSLELADLELETRSYELVLVDPLPVERVPTLLTWRCKNVKADIIVLLPASSSSADRTRCLNAGADVCLTHPINGEELLAHLRALERRNRPLLDPVLRVHDLEINYDARHVHRAGRLIDLTPREFDTLLLLAKNHGKVLTHTMIGQQLFEGSDPVNSNIVSVYIHQLREKIDDGFDLPLILTRRGFGYLLRSEDDSEPG